MANLLYLVHRLPYPPDKGDKVRSYHLLRRLQARHRVFLGTFVDDAADECHVETVRTLCTELHAARLQRRRAGLGGAAGLLRNEPISVGYYRDGGLQRWVDATVAGRSIDAAIVFSSAMAQYLAGHPALPALVDFVDVDSAKWSQFAAARRWPMSWLYRREGVRLLAYERAVSARSRRSFFVTEAEAGLFGRLAPECRPAVEALGNGVDAEYFAPDPARRSPFAGDEAALVFTGAMDYWPNVDAVGWFAAEVLPPLVARWPSLRFHIVGRNPVAAVRALAGEHVRVSGTVADVRPYLQHAAAVVAPLRLARGLQNKILEAMAMARPVVATQRCAAAIGAATGELRIADDAPAYRRELDALLRDRAHGDAIGAAARRRVVARHGWEANLGGLDRHLERILAEREAAA